MNLNIGLFNARGLAVNAVDDLLSHCQHLHLLFITETWLAANRSNLPTTWTQHHCHAVQNNNHIRNSAGLCLLINPSFPYTVNRLPSSSPYLLLATVGNLTLACTYLPPHWPFLECLNVLSQIPITANTIICGDFNARMGEWTGDTSWNPRGRPMKRWLERHSLTVLNKQHAFGLATYLQHRVNGTFTSLIDLFICTAPLTDAHMEVWQDRSLSSDHKMVQLSFLFDHTEANSIPKPVRRTWNLSRLSEEDVEKLYVARFEERAEPLLHILQTLIEEPLPTRPDIDAMTTELNQCIYDAMDTALGTKPARPKHWKWFWTMELQQLADFRELCYQRWRRSTGLNRGIRWTEHQQAVRHLRYKIKASRKQAFKNFCSSLEHNFTKATQVIKQMRRRREVSASFSHPHGPQRAVEVLAEHLSGVYNGDILPGERQLAPRTSAPFSLDDHPFDDLSVLDAITSLPRRKAPGSDHLRSEMLRPIADPLSRVLALLYQLCWRWGYVSPLWRSAQVCAIFKKGDRTLPSNYRPISLTSVLRKAMEKCISHLLHRESPKPDLAQGGFRIRRSALDQALCLHELIQIHRLRHRSDPVLAFLDIKAAYDTVDREIIWQRLYDHGTPAALTTLLQNMFDDVSITVVGNNYVSEPFHPTTGVLQGSVLSPNLYSIYIDTLPKELRSASTRRTATVDDPPTPINALLFADDVALFGTAEEVTTMLRRAEQHSYRLGYRWSPSKCAIVNGEDHNLYLYGELLPNADHFVYLGVPFGPKGMDPEQLISLRSPKATTAMQVLKSLGVQGSGLGELLAAKLYRQFIRPKLEYGLATSKFLVTQMKTIDDAQDTCLRMIFRGRNTTSTSVFRHLTDLPDMRTRILTLQAKFTIRAETLPPDTLFCLLMPRLHNKHSRWRYLQNKNPLLDKWNEDRNNKLTDTIAQWRQNQHDKLRQTRARQAACRPLIGPDPILALPATRKERSRLLRWRLGWLPAQPLPCPCGTHLTKKRSFPQCPLIPSELWAELPTEPPDYVGSQIDFVMNQLPVAALKFGFRPDDQLQQWWPVLLKLLRHIDILCHPDTSFADEPSAGALLLSPPTPDEE
jgi:hypothetical protein